MQEAPALIWINGAFGVGKTSVARHLASRYSKAWLFDPEQIGFLLRRLMPWTQQTDFQSLPAWRQMTVQAIRQALSDRPAQIPIVPMTLVEPTYFAEVVGELRRSGIAVHHFCLLASDAVLRRRIGWRIDRPASRRWALSNIARCGALTSAQFAMHIETDRRRISEIATEIAGLLPPALESGMR
ncbi:MAG: hypothetical protein QOH47_2041 [Sphingomonadales bacterium]|jgi:hypothetical protein|nr:hypothetical protein [Sphingomonadales bacterium]